MDTKKKNVPGKQFQKSYFDVLGLCCSSEVPLIERILNSLDGVKDFSVVVPTKTVIVVHDSLLLSQTQIGLDNYSQNPVPKLEGYDIEGKSIGYVFLGSSPAGVFCLSDVCRTGAKEAINDIKSLGIKTVILTGDSHAAANHAQAQLGGSLDVIHVELLPEDKSRIITELQKEGPTAMIGDGVNDAPALATVDIGISMGVSGSALAQQDIQLAKDV